MFLKGCKSGEKHLRSVHIFYKNAVYTESVWIGVCI